VIRGRWGVVLSQVLKTRPGAPGVSRQSGHISSNFRVAGDSTGAKNCSKNPCYMPTYEDLSYLDERIDSLAFIENRDQRHH
jgi:hypothetical protein